MEPVCPKNVSIFPQPQRNPSSDLVVWMEICHFSSWAPSHGALAECIILTTALQLCRQLAWPLPDLVFLMNTCRSFNDAVHNMILQPTSRSPLNVFEFIDVFQTVAAQHFSHSPIAPAPTSVYFSLSLFFNVFIEFFHITYSDHSLFSSPSL